MHCNTAFMETPLTSYKVTQLVKVQRNNKNVLNTPTQLPCVFDADAIMWLYNWDYGGDFPF